MEFDVDAPLDSRIRGNLVCFWSGGWVTAVVMVIREVLGLAEGSDGNAGDPRLVGVLPMVRGVFSNRVFPILMASRIPGDRVQYTPTPTPNSMLFTIAIILLVLWGLGLVTGTAIGGFIHVLLVIAIIMVLIRVIQGRRIT